MGRRQQGWLAHQIQVLLVPFPLERCSRCMRMYCVWGLVWTERSLILDRTRCAVLATRDPPPECHMSCRLEGCVIPANLNAIQFARCQLAHTVRCKRSSDWPKRSPIDKVFGTGSGALLGNASRASHHLSAPVAIGSIRDGALVPDELDFRPSTPDHATCRWVSHACI
jgi:hypothetical protein